MSNVINTLSQILRTRLIYVFGDRTAANEVQGILQNLPTDIDTVIMPTAASITKVVAQQPAQVTITNAAGTPASNICNVTFQVADGDGNNLTSPTLVVVCLSDASTGIGLTATTASGGIAAGSSGTVIGVLTSAKAVLMMTDATGKAILAITDSAKTGFYPVGTVPGFKTTVGGQLITASYG